MENITIQNLTEEDLPSILEIYNKEIRNGTATFDLKEQSLKQKSEWFHKNCKAYPLLTAKRNQEVLGFAYLSAFREKEAYKQTAEVTLYIKPTMQKQGIGKALLKKLIKEGQNYHFHTLVSVITRGNIGSIQLHEQFGFVYTGYLNQVGQKHGQWLDILFYQKDLTRNEPIASA